MRRNKLNSIGALTGAFVLGVVAMVGPTPASAAAPPSTDLQSTVQGVQNAATAAGAQATGATAPTPVANPLPSVPASVAAPISVLSNELGNTPLPNQDATTGTNTTGQSSPVANANAPINACSLSVGVAADASSGCSTTSVGLNEAGGLADANAPVTAQDNAIGLLNEAATALGLAGGQSSASTVQDGAVNADAPVNICSVNVGLAANTSSDCSTSGTSGPSTQTGVVDADVPVGVCDVIAEVDGDSTSNCPQQADPVTQQGQAADVFVPVTACGAIVEVDGSANGMCMPDAGFPLANDLPTSDASQSAPADAVVPVNACSVVVAVDGTAGNSCEPSHVGTTTTGAAPVAAPVTICAVSAALDGRLQRHVRGRGLDLCPDRHRRKPRDRGDCSRDRLWDPGCTERSGGGLVPAADHGRIDGDPYPGRGNAGLVVGHHAHSGDVGLQLFAAQYADGGDGGRGCLVAGVDGRSTAARGIDRAGFPGCGPGDQPVGASPFGSAASRRLGASFAECILRPVPGVTGRVTRREGSMFTNRDTRGVGGLEEVFRSHEFGRATDPMRGRGRGVSDPADREDALLAQEFGRPLMGAPSLDADGEEEPRPLAGAERPTGGPSEETEVPEQHRAVEASGGGAASGPEPAEAPSTEPAKRRTARYGTFACVTALVALVVGGVMAGAGHHPRSSVSAQGKHDAARPHDGRSSPGPASTGSPAASGSLTASGGSRGPSSGRGTDAGPGSGNAPGGHVSLVGPATFTVTPASPGVPGDPPGVGSGATASPPPSGSTNPVSAAASSAGSAVSGVGSSVTAVAGQLGGAAPAAASAVGVANTIVNTLDQAVSASTE